MKRSLVLSGSLILCLFVFLSGPVYVYALPLSDVSFADLIIKLRPIDEPLEGNKESPMPPPDMFEEQALGIGTASLSFNNVEGGFAWSDMPMPGGFEGVSSVSSFSFQDKKLEVDMRFQERMSDGIARYQNRSVDFTNRYNNIRMGVEKDMQAEWAQLNQYVDFRLDQGRQQLGEWDARWRQMKEEMNRFFERARIAMGEF